MVKKLNNSVDLDDIDEIGKPSGDPVKLMRGEESSDVDFTDLSELKNLKITREASTESVIQDDIKIDNLDEAIARQMFVMESMAEDYTELEDADNRVSGITFHINKTRNSKKSCSRHIISSNC